MARPLTLLEWLGSGKGCVQRVGGGLKVLGVECDARLEDHGGSTSSQEHPADH